MNTQGYTLQKPKAHPMMIIAGIAVILFCAVGISAMMGWIPTSFGSNPDNRELTQSDQSATPAKPAPQRQVAAAPVRQKQANAEPRHQTPAKVPCTNCGTVESTREVTTRAEGSGLGAAGGAVVGGLLGNQVGGGRGKDVMTVVGAIGGAVAGNQIEGHVKATRSYETTVRLEDGSTRAISQQAQPGWQAGDRVKIVDGVVRANG